MGIVKVFLTISIIVLLVFANVFTAEKPAEVKKVNIVKPTHFFSDEVIDVDDGSSYSNISPNNTRRPLGSLTSSTSVNSIATVGTTIGTSWYDHHMIESGGRLVATGPRFSIGSDATVHFVWTGLDGPSYSYLRYYSYNFYNASSGSFASSAPINPQPDSFSGRFLNLDITLDNRAIIAGHSFDPSTGYLMPHLYWQDTPQAETFALENRVPDTLIGESSMFTSLLWPKVVYQEGTNTVTHVFAAIDDGIYEYPAYIRKVGVNEAGVWDDPIYIVDSCYNPSVDISADYNGDKIAIVWMAHIPDAGDCDTCSSIDFGSYGGHYIIDNDVYYQVSKDQGASWEPRVNLTQNVNGEAGFRPYSNLSSLIDTDGDLHIIWSGVYWPENPLSVGWGDNCKLFHWSESQPYIRTIADANYNSSVCSPGPYRANIGDMQLSECDGKIYAIWNQYNSNEYEDDCTEYGMSWPGNAEIYMAVSADDGLTWDDQRNLTNTYTPGCVVTDSITSDCGHEYQPSVSQYGKAVVGGEDWSQATIVDPSGSYSGDSYLDVKYCQDLNPGEIYMSEGLWTINPIKWFRLACVEPVLTPVMSLSWREFAPPDYTELGTQRNEVLSIENLGNTDLHYTTTVIEDNGPSGWLTTSGFSGTVPFGLSNVETGTVHLNNGGVQTTEALLIGRIIFDSDAPSSPDTVSINLLVADTIVLPVIDSILSGCLALAVKNNGNYGAMGIGGANLDWTYSGSDCDTTADVYLYDASPVLVRIDGSDTLYSNALYNTTVIDPTGFRPLVSGKGFCGNPYLMHSFVTDVFVTSDSAIAFQKAYFAPIDIDSCDFIIQGLSIYSNDGNSHNGLRIGELLDWDIPSDTSKMNESGFDFSRYLIYQIGAEFHQDDDPDSCGGVDQPDCPCQDSDSRFGGIAFLESYDKDKNLVSSTPTGMFTASNNQYIYPTGNYEASDLYELMGSTAYSVTDSLGDIHTVMVYDNDLNLETSDTLYYYTVLATVENGTLGDLQAVIDKAEVWYLNNNISQTQCNNIDCCYGSGIDIDGSGDPTPDISDLLYLVDYMFVPGSPAPPCMPAADVNGDLAPVPDITDLLYLVDYMFVPGSPEPVGCSIYLY